MFPSYRNQSVELLCKSTGFYMMETLVVEGLTEISHTAHKNLGQAGEIFSHMNAFSKKILHNYSVYFGNYSKTLYLLRI